MTAGPTTEQGSTTTTTTTEAGSTTEDQTTIGVTSPGVITETQPFDTNQTMPDTTTTGYEQTTTTGFDDTLNPDNTWGEWSGCTATCGGGKKYRYRRCTANETSCDGNTLIDEFGIQVRNITIVTTGAPTTAGDTTTTEWFEEYSTQSEDYSGDYEEDYSGDGGRPDEDKGYGTDCAVCNTQVTSFNITPSYETDPNFSLCLTKH